METPEYGTRRAYGLVIVAALGYGCLMFVWFSLPAYLSTVIADIGLTGTQAGVLVGAVPLTYVPLALVSGVVVDRVGPGRSLAAGVLVFGVAQVGRSAAPGFPSLLAATLLVGVGATAVTFGLPKLVSVLFPPERTGTPSSIYLIGSSAGSAAVFGVGRPVLGPLLGGWRPLFFWSGVVAVGYAAVWYAVARRAGIDDSTAEGDASFSIDSIRRDLRLVLAHRELQLVVVVGTMYLLVNHGVQGWLPTVLEARGLPADLAGRTASGFVASFALGVATVPAVADRYAVRRAALVACGLVVFAGGLGLTVGGVGPLAFVGVVATGVGVGGLSPLVRAIPPELDGVGSELTGTAMGFVFAVGEIGGFLGPVIVGTSRGTTGSFAPGLGLLAAAGLVVVLAGGALRRLRR
ncbi:MULTISPECIES: CynX/NimT family MFS transporter [Halorussus]|uniref:MFS transporter n=1 Tax=Halorussus TaxID=1070314 RepID=UPI000E211F78|nr:MULTISPECIES: MFS transporter [Halorussus]NHN60589.1 MFS transporter [Halorussus sp. JP-T4]